MMGRNILGIRFSISFFGPSSYLLQKFSAVAPMALGLLIQITAGAVGVKLVIQTSI